jgi:tetratricopeptide (TPR) repeat protein
VSQPTRPLGRHGSARPEPWHDRWLALRPGLKIMAELARLRNFSASSQTIRDEERRLAESPAFADFLTPELDEAERGKQIAETITAAAVDLQDRLVIPLDASAGPEQAVLFWCLALRKGMTASRISEQLSRYVHDVHSKDPEQWVATRMWATGRVPHSRSGSGLEKLIERIDLGLAVVSSGDKAAATTTTLTKRALDRLLSEDPATASWLAVFAFFAARPIPVEPLAAEASRGLPHVKGALHQLPLPTYVDRLCKVDLAVRVGQDELMLPSTVATAVREHLDGNMSSAALRAATELLLMAFDEDCADQSRWRVSESLVEHVVSVAGFAQSAPTRRYSAAKLLNRAAKYYYSRALIDSAISTAERAVAAMEQAKGIKSPALAEPLMTLARARMAHGELNEAQVLFERAFSIEDSPSVFDIERAETLNLYGNLLRKQQLPAEAVAVQQEALNMFPTGNRPLAYWRICNDLAMSLQDLERFDEAMILLTDALAGLDGAEGSRAVKRNLALNYKWMGRFNDARKLFEELLDEQLAMPITDLGFIRWVYQPLARTCEELGDQTAADHYWARLKEIDQPDVL